ncbi:hypothetical protein [Lentzea sp. NPDC059081]|uniref:hypothetical protein n=1 Tax=Lentzea sp. NPDC059081 TaxID=3346719 RepID=UPI0036A76DD8
MASAAVIAASVGILLGSAGTASAQDPWGKYPTKAKCDQVGKQVTDQYGGIWTCSDRGSAVPASQRWWLYVI